MEFKIFALKGTEEFGKKISQHLEISLSLLEERSFEDGEHKIRPLESVRGQEIFVIQSLYSDEFQTVNDKICKFLFFLSTLKDASAKKVTAVIPYLAYARKDRKTKDRDPITLKYLARLIEASGADHVIAMDVHNTSAFQNAFRIPTEHLEARVLFAGYLSEILRKENVVVVSPDAGGMKRAELFRTTLKELYHREVGKAYIEKERDQGSVVGGEVIVGNVKDKVAIIIDDIISTGKTIHLSLEALDKAGVKEVYVCVTHGIFTENSKEFFSHPKLKQVFITDTLVPWRIKEQFPKDKLVIIDSSTLFAKALKRMQEGSSVTELLQRYPHAVQELSLIS